MAVAEATKENFEELTAEGIVLVDVWGPDCKPCVALNPHVEKIAEQYPDVSVVKLEAPKARRLCMSMRMMSLPVFLIFKDGEEVVRLSDPQLTPDKLQSWVDEELESVRGEVKS
jgi:thioredoxin-like negative regulator of GroEL